MEYKTKEDSRMKACIIGAGAAGLCAARHLTQLKSQFVFDMFEQTSNVGGTWNYTECTGLDSNGLPIHTSMYTNMRTNLPLKVMEFEDFPSDSCTSYVHHSQVLEYLQNYAKHFNLIQYIKFNHQVVRVSRSEHLWKVTVKNLTTKQIEENTYDTIFVCNGRYAKPKLPNSQQIKGIDKFKGKVIHSHDYRVPEVFRDQTVLVLGAGPSGIDICLEVSDVANKVILCHQLKEPLLHLPSNISQEVTQIKQISETKIQFENGNQYEELDAIIFATGYEYDFTFLDQSCKIHVNSNGRVEGVYLHLINTSYPSMAIWAIVQNVIPFRIYDQQVLFFIKCLTKEITLPSKIEMENETQKDLLLRKSMGMSERHAHKMTGQLFWQYSDKLVEISHIMPVKPVIKKLFNHLVESRKLNITGYKHVNFDIISDNEFVVRKH